MSQADADPGSDLVSVSLVTYQGRDWLPGCVDSVLSQDHANLELLIHDNGSADGSQAWLRERAAGDPRVSLTATSANLGFAAAHNRNISHARGEFVLVLNQDVELDQGFLSSVVSALRQHPEVGAVQAKVLRLRAAGIRSTVLDTTGLVMHRDRHASIRGHLQEDGGPGSPRQGPVWGADGPAPVYRWAALTDARLPRRGGGWEVFDEDFFSHKEDVDLAWRLHRLGWVTWYEPTAIAWHARTGTGYAAASIGPILRATRANDTRVRVASWRNQRLMQVKNDALRDVVRDLPWILRREAVEWGYVLIADRARLRAIPSLIRSLPSAARKRRVLVRKVQRRRGAASHRHSERGP